MTSDYELIIYPRGFVGPKSSETGGGEAAGVVQDIQIAGATVRASLSQSGGKKSYDTMVDYLYKKVREDEYALDDFLTREEILKKAKVLFSVNGQVLTMRRFVVFQLLLANITEKEQKAMIEFFEFMLTGKRGLYHDTWLTFVADDKNQQAPNVHQVPPKPITKQMKAELIETNKKLLKDLEISIVDGINKWVEHRDGFSHLLSTLYFFFGADE